MMVNILKLLEIFYISNTFEVSPRRLRSFWLDLAAAKTPCSLNRSYGYAFGHEPS